MAILLFLFALSIGVATFIENSYDTITARMLIYNSKWFELILILLVFNFINNLKRYQLFSLKKWTMLTIHIGFITVLVGAGITRYLGFEGVMIIPENESANYMYSSEPYLQVYAHNEKQQFSYDQKWYYSPLINNSFNLDFDFKNNNRLKIDYLNYIPYAKEVLHSNVSGGEKILELMLPGREILYLKEGETRKKGALTFSFNNNDQNNAIRFFEDESGLFFYSPFNVLRTNMSTLSVEDRQKSMNDIPMDTLFRDSLHTIGLRNLLNIQGFQVMVSSIHQNALFEIESTENEDLPDALQIRLSLKDEAEEVTIFGGFGLQSKPVMLEIGDWFFQLGYGSKPISLPFEIYLKEFRLMKYPGSESPSSFESDISIRDQRNNKKDDYHLFMNNVVDYDGFRFFQSSYDWSNEQKKKANKDPDITILSVNHDFWGTWISYSGYFLLAFGFIATLLNRNSRFLKVRKQIIKMRKKRFSNRALFLSMILAFQVHAQSYQPVQTAHADSLGKLLVQSVEGRIQPIHTLAYDIFHKVSKKDRFVLKDGRKLDAMQVMVDFMVDPDFWANEKIIYVKPGTGVSDSLGIIGKYASIRDFIKENGEEKLLEQLKISFNKKDIQKNVFDKELIKVNERFNILLQLMYGNLLKIYPIKNDMNDSWVSWDHEYANRIVGGKEHSLQNITFSKIWLTYLNDLKIAKDSGNYKNANEMLRTIKVLQKLNANKKLLPTEALIDQEIYYNKTNIFHFLKNTYGLLSVFLLLFSFIDALISNRKTWMFKLINITLWLLIAMLIIAFFYHTYGLVLRWNIAGHAPWSNGYEALTFIAWGSILAGLIFIRNSKITLAATSLLAFFILMTAGHSSFDPQLTNLQPVLKSYWLMIHVACITISYGFLGLGFILGLINLFTYLGKTRSNANQLDGVITELTYINEMTLTIGLVLATIGTFLGGIWASESWGRYWGWDAKETWALVIVLTYAIILHFRLIPGMRGRYIFNVASVLGFSSVLMTFIGVNYYLSKGLHSYARGDTPVFPMWAWIIILSVISLIFIVGFKERSFLKKLSR